MQSTYLLRALNPLPYAFGCLVARFYGVGWVLNWDWGFESCNRVIFLFGTGSGVLKVPVLEFAGKKGDFLFRMVLNMGFGY